MNKEEEILKYSNPKIAHKKAKLLFGNNIEFKISTRKDKKYMIKNPNTNKWVHFGQMGNEDFTKHKNELRRERFRTRNKKWSNSDEYTPAYLSYYILW